MSKKKILHLAKWYPNQEEPLLGIFVRKHIQSVQKHYNHKVISIYQTDTIHSNIHRVENQVNNRQEVIFYYKKGFFNKVKVLCKVWKEIKRFQPHLLHAHVMGWTSILAYFFSSTSQIPFLITEHWSGYRNKGYTQVNFVSKILRKISARKAQKICVVSDFLKDDMLKCGLKANYITLGNVVDGKALDIEKNKAFSFVFAGDLVQETKNVRGILEAFSELLNQHNNIQLDIIGDGKDLKNYKELSNKLNLNDYVHFHGNQSNDYVFKILSQSHVLLLNSYFETFSIICAEALLCGIPVISTKCGGPESFLDDKTGLLIDCGNHKQLITAMESVINNYNQYESEELKNRAHQFSLEAIGEKINREYLQVLH